MHSSIVYQIFLGTTRLARSVGTTALRITVTIATENCSWFIKPRSLARVAVIDPTVNPVLNSKVENMPTDSSINFLLSR